MVGAITGTLQGAAASPSDWIDQVDTTNPVNQYELARKLYEALLNNTESMRAQLRMIEAST